MKFDKSDIEILDSIIDFILEHDTYIHDSSLKKADKYKDYKPSELRLESERIVSILEFYDCAKIKRRDDGNIIEKNAHTKKFREHGGFENIYQDELNRLEKLKEKETLETDLAKSNIEANVLNIENARKNKWYTWINIIIGVLNLVLLALQLLKD